MELDKIKLGANYNYATPSSQGRFKAVAVVRDASNSWWVVGHDRVKGKDITVRPGQVSK